MPDKVSETTVETAQVVEEKPSEETQVAAPEPSEVVEPVQEPAPEIEETPEQQRERIRKEVLESPEGKAALEAEAKSISDKSTLKLRLEYEGRETVQRQAQEREKRLTEARQQREQETQVYSQLLELRQAKPEEFVKALDNPTYRGIWDRGGRIAPTTEEIEGARSDGFTQLYGTYYKMLMSKPELANLSDEEAASIASDKFKGVPDAHAAYLDAITDLLATKKAQALVAKEKEGIEEAARKNEREKIKAEYREAGVGPVDLEGKGASGALTKAKYAAMTPEERAKLSDAEIDAMTVRGV